MLAYEISKSLELCFFSIKKIQKVKKKTSEEIGRVLEHLHVEFHLNWSLVWHAVMGRQKVLFPKNHLCLHFDKNIILQVLLYIRTYVLLTLNLRNPRVNLHKIVDITLKKEIAKHK